MNTEQKHINKELYKQISDAYFRHSLLPPASTMT